MILIRDDGFKVPEQRHVRICEQGRKAKAIANRDYLRRSCQLNKRAQFMVITIVLIGISFFTIFLLIHTIDRSSVAMFEEKEASFENVQNSILQRNDWIRTYWWDLNWENRTVMLVPTTLTAQVNPQIPPGFDCNKEVRVINSAGAEVPSNVNSVPSPCQVIFSAPATDTYSIYWNNPSATVPAYRGSVPPAGTPTGSMVKQESSPKSKFCPHAQAISSASGEKLDCAVQGIIGSTKVNYSINYKSLEVSYQGNLN